MTEQVINIQNSKTVDELVKLVFENMDMFDCEEDACVFVVAHYKKPLIKILSSPLNIPSKHDLSIVNEINRIEGYGVSAMSGIYKKILQLYKNRK